MKNLEIAFLSTYMSLAGTSKHVEKDDIINTALRLLIPIAITQSGLIGSFLSLVLQK